MLVVIELLFIESVRSVGLPLVVELLFIESVRSVGLSLVVELLLIANDIGEMVG